MGKIRVTQLLSRAGLQLAATIVGRMVKRSPAVPPPPVDEDATKNGMLRTDHSHYRSR
jgi:hypothetical protein